MILAIDMGNTNIVMGAIDDEKTYFVERVRAVHGRGAGRKNHAGL